MQYTVQMTNIYIYHIQFMQVCLMKLYHCPIKFPERRHYKGYITSALVFNFTLVIIHFPSNQVYTFFYRVSKV